MAPAIPALVAAGRAGVRAQGGGITLPPPFPYGGPGMYVFDPQSARRIPAVGRAIQLYAGMVKQMPMDAYRGYARIEPTPRILQKPDLLRGGPEFLQLSVEDYLLSGNTISLITARGADGWPLAVTWLPITWCFVQWNPPSPIPTYYYLSQELPIDDVIHIRRGADRYYPVRGVGVVEEHLSSLDRMAMEEEYERNALTDGAVPSIAVITPQATLTQEVADEAKERWAQKFGGPVREPVILPNGTVVQPLAWSPTDTQLAEARRLSLGDVANMFNIDGYWFGAPIAGMTYRTAGPQYQSFLRTSLEPVLADLEDAWSYAWMPRGTAVRFHRAQLLREDLATSATAAVALKGAGIAAQEEARVMVGLPPIEPGAIGTGADMGGTSGGGSPDASTSETEGA
jgi:HK97 family phage portal protein